jgi:molecular chaperone GrpE (heat shock protein)
MPDFHVATIRFLNPLLKLKKLQLSKAAHTDEFATLNEEFENLRKRLFLEIEYAMTADGNEDSA